MKRLHFLVNWGKSKETAWSGTYFSLYKALQRHYDVNDVDLRIFWPVDFLLRRVFRLRGVAMEYWRSRFLRREYRKLKGTVFQFCEILADCKDRNTYMYVDLTVGYVNYMRQNLKSDYLYSGFQNSDQKILQRRGEEQIDYMKSCSGVFTMGNWLREWLVKQGVPNNKIHAVGGGTNVDISLIAPRHKNHNRILFVGKDFKRKGGHVTYEAFKWLRNHGYEVELFVIGPSCNPIPDAVEGFHFIGQIPFSEEAFFYNMCDLFCMPSYFEAYGLVFVEALTFGLPCIGRDCYEMPYFIEEGKTGLLLRHDDPVELAHLMLRVLQDSSFAENVVQNRAKYIHNYSWDTVADRIAKAIGQ